MNVDLSSSRVACSPHYCMARVPACEPIPPYLASLHLLPACPSCSPVRPSCPLACREEYEESGRELHDARADLNNRSIKRRGTLAERKAVKDQKEEVRAGSAPVVAAVDAAPAAVAPVVAVPAAVAPVVAAPAAAAALRPL